MRNWIVTSLLLVGVALAAAERGLTVQAARQAGLDDYDPARFHALIIGINEYHDWTDLRSARPDAEAIAEVLVKHYGYEPEKVRLMTDEQATRRGILAALEAYRQLGEEDSLLIYYAGHGWMDDDHNGFWVPTEAPLDSKYDYLSNARIVSEYFKKYDVRHLLVIADSCFAGAMLRAGEYRREQTWELPAGYRKPSRWIFTSGDLAPVEDDAGGGHSPFATRLLQFLKYSDQPAFGVNDLYVYVRRNLSSEAIAMPLATTSHMPGGEFVFARLDTPLQWPVQPATPAPTTPRPVPPAAPVPEVTRPELSEPPEFDRPWTVPLVELQLQPVRAGSFTRGSTKGEPDEQPVHKVRLTRGFWMGIHEVTNQQFLVFLHESGRQPVTENADFSLMRQGGLWRLKEAGAGNHPVSGVDWEAAVAFGEWLTEQERQAGRLPSGYEYRLPTEAEWEYVSRAGTSTPYSFGYGHGLERFAWYAANAGHQSREVGTRLPNPWGIYDLHGNVWEWCRDWYDTYPDRVVNDPLGALSGRYRTLRGGSFAEDATYQRAANRGRAKPDHQRNTIGFRIVLGPRL